jgi:hypothetical protein
MLTALLAVAVCLGSLQIVDKGSAATKSKGPQAAATARPAADGELATKARRLLRQLDAAELAARDAAFSELVKLGPEVLDHLPKPGDNPPAAVRDAIRRLRNEFDRQAADRAMQASTVTLERKAIPLAQVAEELVKQTGNKVLLNSVPEDKTLDLDLNGVSFWKALDVVADQAKLSVYSYAQDAAELRPALASQRPRGPGAFYTGPLRIQVNQLRLQRDLRLSDGGSLEVGLGISWEPRLRPIMLRQKLDALEAADENGQPIAVERAGELPILVHQGASAVEFDLPFKAPPRSVKSIANLKGTVEVLMPGKAETFEFGELSTAKKREQQKHNATVTLDGVRKVGEVWEVRIRVKYEQAFNALDSHLMSWLLNNEAYLLNDKGEKVENAGFETTQRSEEEIGVAYLFEAPGGLGGHRLVYHTPSTIYRLSVDYVVKELPLP